MLVGWWSSARRRRPSTSLRLCSSPCPSLVLVGVLLSFPLHRLDASDACRTVWISPLCKKVPTVPQHHTLHFSVDIPHLRLLHFVPLLLQRVGLHCETGFTYRLSISPIPANRAGASFPSEATHHTFHHFRVVGVNTRSSSTRRLR